MPIQRTDRLVVDMSKILDAMDKLILAIPTGPVRNRVTEANILLIDAERMLHGHPSLVENKDA